VGGRSKLDSEEFREYLHWSRQRLVAVVVTCLVLGLAIFVYETLAA
jgi:hypothetical protein